MTLKVADNQYGRFPTNSWASCSHLVVSSRASEHYETQRLIAVVHAQRQSRIQQNKTTWSEYNSSTNTDEHQMK